MNVKLTRSQERILQLLITLPQGLTAQEMYIELRNRKQTLGLATVYRSLEVLKQQGTIQARTLPNGEAVYSSVQQDQHHLTCLRCGVSVTLDQCPVHQLEEDLQRSHQFKVFYHTLEFFGLCDRCQLASVKNG